MPRILSWNLFHGRSRAPAGRELLDEFSAAIAGWAWDVALLQEVPPWWPRPLASRAGASMRMALTSRNWLLGLRAPLARRLPDVLKSEGGGCNAILVRGQAIRAHRWRELTRTPERRVVHGVLLDDGAWVANLHASKESTGAQNLADVRLAAATVAYAWAGAGRPAILGGDFNHRRPSAEPLAHMGGRWVDHVCAQGFAREAFEVLDAGALSDHRPIAVQLRRASGGH